MALMWDWKEKVGTAKLANRERKEFELSLYNGNALLIALFEYKQDNEDMYNMHWFFVDKPHMNRMLGLTKGTSNCLNAEGYKITELSLDTAKCKNMWDIVKAFVKAFGDITIKFYNSKGGDTA